LRADVSGLSGHGVASGSVLFAFDGESIGVGSFSLNNQGTAATARGVFTIPAGQHSIVAQYLGDSSFNPNTSAAVPTTVLQASTTVGVVASSNSNNVAEGTSVPLAANIGTTSSGLGPSGTVTFLSGGTPIPTAGNPVLAEPFNGNGNIQNGTFIAAQGLARLNTVLPVGQNAITAQYSGDSNYTGSVSAAITVNVGADFVFAATGPSITIASPGGSGTAMLTVTGQPGYGGTINFSAASCAGLPRESTCSFNPASVTSTGSTTLTISTTAAHSARLEGPAGWTTSLGATLAGIFLLGKKSRRRNWSCLLSLIAASCLITIVSCGGGSSGGGGGGNKDPGTPAGTSTVTVTATSGTLTHTTALTLTIQ
jgi:hypothetical protein